MSSEALWGRDLEDLHGTICLDLQPQSMHHPPRSTSQRHSLPNDSGIVDLNETHASIKIRMLLRDLLGPSQILLGDQTCGKPAFFFLADCCLMPPTPARKKWEERQRSSCNWCMGDLQALLSTIPHPRHLNISNSHSDSILLFPPAGVLLE